MSVLEQNQSLMKITTPFEQRKYAVSLDRFYPSVTDVRRSKFNREETEV
jgi:hypothetical protein